jgi:hypothetical protein
MLAPLSQLFLSFLPLLPLCGSRGPGLAELFLLGLACFLSGVVVGGLGVALCLSGRCRRSLWQFLVITLEEREVEPAPAVIERGIGRLVRYRA